MPIALLYGKRCRDREAGTRLATKRETGRHAIHDLEPRDFRRRPLLIRGFCRLCMDRLGLFHMPDSPVRREPMASLDALNQRFGRGTMGYAASGTR